jgi:hypothetical protein
MVACIREAIAVHPPDVDKHHRIQLSGPVPEFNVIYGTDSSSCAQEMEAHWDNGTLLTLGKSRTSSLAETLLHVWRELGY